MIASHVTAVSWCTALSLCDSYCVYRGL